eukprot:snap_masked-scaffold_11-processed-gene-6.26-mRNA-1 protein AED:1.00 eAED:1.00 QI:0/-1/0/0/-1/1/1/0/237
MDGFKKVDDKHMRKIFHTENQANWKQWHESKTNQEHIKHNETSKNIPVFPKLGNSVDETYRNMGAHNDVFIPKEAMTNTRFSHRETVKVSDEGYIEEPALKKLKNGSSYLNEDEHAIDQYKEIEFIPSDKFIGGRIGYVFTKGEEGLGYYLDVPREGIQKISAAMTKEEEIKEKVRKELIELTTRKSRNYVKRDIKHLFQEKKEEQKQKGKWKKTRDPLTRRVVYVNDTTGEKKNKI